MAWLEAISGFKYIEAVTGIVIPPRIPIVSILSLSRRTTSLSETATWEALTEGPSATGSFIILKRRTKTNQYLGFAIYFYQNEPDIGYGRVKTTYSYGWNLDTNILGEWCTLKVALKVLNAVLEATTPTGSRDYGVADVRIGLDPETRLKSIKERIAELESKYFPPQQIGMAFI